MTKRCKRRRRGGGETSRHTHTGSALYRCLPSCSIVHVVLIFLFFYSILDIFSCPFFFVLTFPTFFFRMTSSHCKTTPKEKRKSRGTNFGREVSWLSHTHTLCACALIAHQRF